MTKENTEYLSGMQEKLGLSKEQAEKIIKGVQNQRLTGSLEAAKNTGQLTLQKVLDMKDSGVDVDSFISEELRLSLYAKEVGFKLYCLHHILHAVLSALWVEKGAMLDNIWTGHCSFKLPCD